MQKLTKKQFLKRQTLAILTQILMDLLPEDEQSKVTEQGVRKQFPKASYFKDADTQMIKVGLSFKGVRKLVKRNPYIQVSDVKAYFNIG
tara:strand:+ start:163 stop:429 length:267 start_codon:yes stop_codon:yes gene_type:complete